MKNWNAPEIEELNVKETAYGWTGIHRDGGFIGDGQISGHLTWSNNKNNGSMMSSQAVSTESISS